MGLVKTNVLVLLILAYGALRTRIGPSMWPRAGDLPHYLIGALALPVMDLVANACKERIYPVGRLDRATTGVLLLTNDGALAKKLTHPSHGAKKIYQVTLDKPFEPGDMVKLKQGLTLEDGPVMVDRAELVKEDDLYTLGVELHVGRNRIVRRMFAHLGYEVVKLDRTSFAGLTKKSLERGHYRILNEKEISFLKML